VISGNGTSGIEINAANGTQVLGNLIGTSAAGTAAVANVMHGVQVRSSANVIVGSVGGGNVVSASGGNGIDVTDSSDSTQIVGNKVGTNQAGTAALPNPVGIAIGNTVTNTQVGGTSAGQRNLVSGNTNQGIILFSAASGTVIQGNYIGTDVTGTTAVGNNEGVSIGSTISNMIVGGTVAGAGNVISGNALSGVSVDGTNIEVLGNRIGTNAAGSAAVGNAIGVGVTNQNNSIGNATGGGNVISGGTTGIKVTGATAINTQILGNRIGTDASGLAAIPNTFSIDIGSNAFNTTVGGTAGVSVGGDCTGSCNLIVGQYGIFAQLASTITIAGNYIGTNVHGTGAFPGAGNGIDIRYSPNVTIGGATSAQRNVIGGFSLCGINLQGAATTTAQVLGNYIGVGANNATLIPNGVGINVAEVSGAKIGAAVVGAGNVVIGNTLKGIWLNDGSSTAQVFGNEVGRAGAGNIDDGIRITSVSPGGNHQIGSINVAQEANLIRFNGGSGIHVTSPIVGNGLRGNSIEGNAVEGITLDPGANNNIAAPALGSVDATVAHTLHLTIATGGTIDVYKADALGQGKTYLLSDGPHAAGPVDIALNALVSSGDTIVATVTDASNNTSEFSNVVAVP
jgi:hypothetical protein